jgi:hypothetical protein
MEQLMTEGKAPVGAGLSVILGFIVGFAALLAGLLAVFNEYDYVGAGLCFIAAALAFGLITNSIFRK